MYYISTNKITDNLIKIYNIYIIQVYLYMNTSLKTMLIVPKYYISFVYLFDLLCSL